MLRTVPRWRGRSRVPNILLERAANGFLVIIGAILISFILINLSGNPADAIGGDLGPAQRAEIARTLGYDQPLFHRLISYVIGALHGNFGISYRTMQPALNTALSALPNTLVLVVLAIGLALAFAGPIVILTILHPDSRLARVTRVVLMALQGVPDFWFALLLTLIFALDLGLLPALGFSSADSLIMPVTALALPILPIFVRMLQGEMLDAMAHDFVLAQQAKGLSSIRIVLRHVLPNAAGPFITLVAYQAGVLVGGTLLIEVVFDWPGLGNTLYAAASTRDLAVIECIVVVIAASYVVLNLCADVLVVMLDPRIRRTRAR